MLVSKLLLPTLREVPAEAEVVSHQLLVRAGFIRKSAAGVYTLLPLAWRVVKKIENIIREEMDSRDGQEIMMPIIQPAELWQESGRWDVYGPELFRFKDRHGRDFCLGPTHEEIITDLVRGEVRSYKQLPLLLYQIQNKYRDERRPRFGLMRGREFIMKDLYSFDRDEDGLEITYQKMFDAYTRIFSRCGLRFRPVEADSGAIGGSDTHEFMVLAESGEAVVVYCPSDSCGYAANDEKAESPVEIEVGQQDQRPLSRVETPGTRTVEQVTEFLGISPKKLIKTIFYQTEKGLVAALVRGDRDINEVKLKKEVGSLELELANPQRVEEVTGSSVGFVGPIGIKDTLLVVDQEVAGLVNAVAGANQVDNHLVDINPGRDFSLDRTADIRLVKAGDPCPLCGKALLEARGIEVGQVFKLGTKYSSALNAVYSDQNGQELPIVMGCYGIGVTRTMAASIEQNNDENGIVWPVSIAPYQVVVIPVNIKNIDQQTMASRVYNKLLATGIEAVMDDRDERPGVKFKDADLVGYPVRVTVGGKAVSSGMLEVSIRKKGDIEMIAEDEIVRMISDFINKESS
ncbi:MAG: proline--tRNA ligase [Peptococcaceae bacterium]|nr:proline--tRNA ligase [Peptococcaceae bacterium]